MANKWKQAFLTLFLMLISLAPAWSTDPAIKHQIDALNRQKHSELLQALNEEEKSVGEIELHFVQRRNEALGLNQTYKTRQIDQEERALKGQMILSFQQRRQAINAKYESLIRNLKQQR